MNFEHIDTFYFIGIGGIGMSGLARYFAAQGHRVLGYDRTPTPLTHALQHEGIAIQYDEDVSSLTTLCPASTIVVRTAAIAEDMALCQWFLTHGFQLLKRAEVLGIVTRQARALCVAGTHGKTTTSTILAHILHGSHVGANAFLGGVSTNYQTNLLIDKTSDIVVVEADEFDRSFHHLTPYISIITSMDADHLDIYGTPDAYQASFATYASLVQEAIVVKKGLNIGNRIQAKVYTYEATPSEGHKADFYADNVRITDGRLLFDFYTPTSTIANIQLGVPVWVNVENSVAAMAVAWLMGATEAEIREGLQTFKGVHRRFNIHLNTPQVAYIDDYAHHPAELKASIDSLRLLYPNRHLIGIFQPHLYSRTRDFADDFARVLSLLDEVALLPIYPAREEPIQGINSEWLMSKMTTQTTIVDKAAICPWLNTRVNALLSEKQPCVVMTLGAGDIDQLTNEITTCLTMKINH
jgi:UDP-N-acetylmuramate--alanine ligase